MNSSRDDLNLSPAMLAAIAAAKASKTGRLYRWPGGYWMPYKTAKPTKVDAMKMIDVDSHSTRTIYALISRGVFRVVERMGQGQGGPWIVEPSESSQP